MACRFNVIEKLAKIPAKNQDFHQGRGLRGDGGIQWGTSTRFAHRRDEPVTSCPMAIGREVPMSEQQSF